MFKQHIEGKDFNAVDIATDTSFAFCASSNATIYDASIDNSKSAQPSVMAVVGDKSLSRELSRYGTDRDSSSSKRALS